MKKFKIQIDSSFVPNNASSGCKETGVALFLDGIF